MTEFKADLEDYLGSLKESKVRTLEDVINFNDAHASVEFPSGEGCQEVYPLCFQRLIREIFVRAIQSRGYDDEIYQKAKEDCFRIGAKEGIDAVLQRYNLDALVVPAEGLASEPTAIAGMSLEFTTSHS